MAVEVVTPDEFLGTVIGDLRAGAAASRPRSRAATPGRVRPASRSRRCSVTRPICGRTRRAGRTTRCSSTATRRSPATSPRRSSSTAPASRSGPARKEYVSEVRLRPEREAGLNDFLKGAVPSGEGEVRARQAALQRRHHRSHRPRQDHADGGDHQGPGRGAGRRGQELRGDRQRSRGEGARHHDRDLARRVPDGEPPLRPRRLPRPRRLHQEHDHRRRADGRRDPRGLGGRRPDAPDPRAHPPRPPGGRALHRRLPEQGRHGRRRGAARARRGGGPRPAQRVRLPGRRHPRSSRARRSRRSRATRSTRPRSSSWPRRSTATSRSPSARSTSRS